MNSDKTKKLESDKYLLIDWYVPYIEKKRLANKKTDCFTDELKDIERIDISNNEKTGEKKDKIICSNDKLVAIMLDKYGRINGYSNNRIETIENFLEHNRVLKIIDIPNVRVIGKLALYDKKLKSIIIPEGVTEIGKFSFRNNQLNSIVIPEGVTEIDKFSFHNNQLNSNAIPIGTTEIDKFSFRNNQLNSIAIPEGVTEIDEFSFTDNQSECAVISSDNNEDERDNFQDNGEIKVRRSKVLDFFRKIYST